jgi:lipoyl(octanoyl) transferase
MGHPLAIEWLGSVGYREALACQEDAVADRRAGRAPDRLLLLEHPAVITFGRSGRARNLRTAPEALAARGVEVHHVARGGDVTYHGPGQLVGYLVVDLAQRGQPDAVAFLRRVEATLISALADLGLAGEARTGMTGVFVRGSDPPRKLASIGVGLRGWITWHGFALNATVDLDGFRDIVPCGLHGVEMTSLARELGWPPGDASAAAFDRTRLAVAEAFGRSFG